MSTRKNLEITVAFLECKVCLDRSVLEGMLSYHSIGIVQSPSQHFKGCSAYKSIRLPTSPAGTAARVRAGLCCLCARASDNSVTSHKKRGRGFRKQGGETGKTEAENSNATADLCIHCPAPQEFLERSSPPLASSREYRASVESRLSRDSFQ